MKVKCDVIFAVIAIFFVFVISSAVAEEEKLTDEAELSYVDSSGNSETSTLSAKNIMTYKFTKKVSGSWRIAALNSESAGQRNAEQYSSEARLDYFFTDHFYASFLAGWLKDKFSGIDQRYYSGLGAGYKFLTGPKHILLGEAGLDYVFDDYTDDTDNDYLRGRLFTSYQYNFTKKNKFTQSLEYLMDFEDSDNYNGISVTSISSSINDILSLKTSYEVKYDNKPVPATLDKTDTILSVTLVVFFTNLS